MAAAAAAAVDAAAEEAAGAAGAGAVSDAVGAKEPSKKQRVERGEKKAEEEEEEARVSIGGQRKPSHRRLSFRTVGDGPRGNGMPVLVEGFSFPFQTIGFGACTSEHHA